MSNQQLVERVWKILTKRNGIDGSDGDAYALDSLNLGGAWQIGGLSKRIKKIVSLLPEAKK